MISGAPAGRRSSCALATVKTVGQQTLCLTSSEPKGMRFTSLKLNSLRDLLLEELRDLYDAERQLIAASRTP